MTDDNEVKRHIVMFRAPPHLASAVAAAAKKDFCTISDVCRRTMAESLRDRGLLKEESA